MYRYTTPTIPIIIEDIDFANVASFRITIERGSASLLFEIGINDSRVDSENNTINLVLTQEETATFNEGKAEVQARIIYTDGTIQATEKAKLVVKGVFDEVII